MEKYYPILFNPVLITILSVYTVVMVTRGIYLLAHDEFPEDIFSFTFGQPIEMFSSFFGIGIGSLLSIPFIIVGFVLMCLLIPLTIWWGVIAMFQFLAFVFELF